MATLSPAAGPGEPTFGSFGHDVAYSRQAVTLPTILTVLMLIVGFTAASIAGVDASRLFRPYLFTGWAVTFLSVLLYIFVDCARLARRLADDPIPRVIADLKARMPVMLLPALVFPLFLVGFTTAKTAIPFLVGFRWDAFWADADKLIFGTDVWRISHAVLGIEHIRVWEFFYSAVWGGALILYKANIALYARLRTVGIVYTAMMLTWLVGGWFMAYAMSAAGPIFAHLVDPSLTERFAPLREILAVSLPSDSSTRLTMDYLAIAMDRGIAVKGGGISAMPSMHIGAVTIYVLSARGTRWLLPAVVFWIIIFLGSAYFGYHYWLDGVVAALVGIVCWKFAEACFRERTEPLPELAVARP